MEEFELLSFYLTPVSLGPERDFSQAGIGNVSLSF